MIDKFSLIKDLNNEHFKRLAGIRRETFDKAVEILKIEDKIKKRLGGKPNKLVVENQLLLMLEYYREYRSHIFSYW